MPAYVLNSVLDNKFTPMMKDYFESWYQERLNGEGGGKADDSNVDTSLHNGNSSGG